MIAQEPIRRPNLAGLARMALAAGFANEPIQSARELAQLMVTPIFWGAGVARGDGHSVIVVPGLFGGDGYLRPLRSWLGRIGYRAVKSGIDFNRGWSEEIIRHLIGLARDEAERSGEPVTMLGHSLGGLMSRAVAYREPALARHLIMLGSPLSYTRGVVPSSIRITSIYSPRDPIVRHPRAIAPEAHAENIAIRGSHIGLAFNRTAILHIANRLGHSPALL